MHSAFVAPPPQGFRGWVGGWVGGLEPKKPKVCVPELAQSIFHFYPPPNPGSEGGVLEPPPPPQKTLSWQANPPPLLKAKSQVQHRAAGWSQSESPLEDAPYSDGHCAWIQKCRDPGHGASRAAQRDIPTGSSTTVVRLRAFPEA